MITQKYLKEKYPRIKIIKNRGRFNYLWLPPREKEPVRGHYVLLRSIDWQIPYQLSLRRKLREGSKEK